jgi:hypothetical protein
MRSKGLWRWYINIMVTILDIIHRPAFYLKHKNDNTCTSQEAHYVYVTTPTGLWRRCINIIVTIVDTNNRPVESYNITILNLKYVSRILVKLKLYLLSPTDWVPPKDGDRIQSPIFCALEETTIDNIKNCDSYFWLSFIWTFLNFCHLCVALHWRETP